ncbi:hypothetical protein KC19_VG045100, partial [Ceratodon purpureus]
MRTKCQEIRQPWATTSLPWSRSTSSPSRCRRTREKRIFSMHGTGFFLRGLIPTSLYGPMTAVEFMHIRRFSSPMLKFTLKKELRTSRLLVLCVLGVPFHAV